jgi:hypothetical protein
VSPALAKRGGLAQSSVNQYLREKAGRASEPGVEALVKLADAGRVSIGWLASGRPPKDPGAALPEGYGLFPCFDLRPYGWRIHGLHGDPASWIPLNFAWVTCAPVSLNWIECIEAPETADNFPPAIGPGDILAIDRTRGGDPNGILPLTISDGRLYLSSARGSA